MREITQQKIQAMQSPESNKLIFELADILEDVQIYFDEYRFGECDEHETKLAGKVRAVMERVKSA